MDSSSLLTLMVKESGPYWLYDANDKAILHATDTERLTNYYNE